MRDRIINIMCFIALWFISYYFGAVQGAAYDNQWDGLDIIAIVSGLGGMYYFYRAVNGS